MCFMGRWTKMRTLIRSAGSPRTADRCAGLGVGPRSEDNLRWSRLRIVGTYALRAPDLRSDGPPKTADRRAGLGVVLWLTDTLRWSRPTH